MNTPTLQPTKEKGFVFLKEGDVLTRDIQFWSAWEKKWVPISKQSIGYCLDGDSVSHFRRRAK